MSVPDVLARGLRVVFVGINPGLTSAAVGHHFARPGNRFWPALHRSGFTDRVLAPDEGATLVERRLGITNLVARESAGVADLTVDELRSGARMLEGKVATFEPRFVAILGIGAYRSAFARPKAAFGRQPEPIARSALWVLPNPSGLNAHYTLDDLATVFAELRAAAEASSA